VSSVAEALAHLSRASEQGRAVPLVLTDSHMPGTDGFDLAEEIKRVPALADAVVLMLTSGDYQGDLQRCRDLGVAAHLTKPVRQAELRTAIAKAIQARTTRPVPVHAAPAASSPGVTTGSSASGEPGRRVLVVEDNATNQKLALAILAKEGYSAVVAESGRDALALFRERGSEFDLILMDVQMPGMDGLETTGAIRQIEALRVPSGQSGRRRIPIIAVTARAMQGDRDRCLAAGMDDYLAKPLHPADLLALLRRYLPGRAPGLAADLAGKGLGR
jgi:CheY-like chemotaxis protein